VRWQCAALAGPRPGIRMHRGFVPALQVRRRTMPRLLKRVPDWLAIIVVSKLVTSYVILHW
jgi:hypothetical protein